MSIDAILAAIRALAPDEQRIVAETILDELGDSESDDTLSDAEKELIEKRLAAYRANPERVVPYEEASARIRAKLSQ
jgi:putative addiction module component (TIGR02574 family)